jgi:hypothetical protein
MKDNRPVYTLQITPIRGFGSVPALRRVLKSLLRDAGMQCLHIDADFGAEAEKDKELHA